MQDAFDDFGATITNAAARLNALGEEEASRPRAEDKWSAKQIIGHLIDSAANNHRRFVLAQLTDHLAFEGYEQNGWVSVQRYDAEPWAQLVALWRAYNL